MTKFTNCPEIAAEAIKKSKEVFALFLTDIKGKYHAVPCSLDYVTSLRFESDESDDSNIDADYYAGFLTFAIRNRKSERKNTNDSNPATQV